SGRLEVDTTTDGMLLPRLTTTQRDAIASPVKGLVIYNTDEDDLQGYDGAAWLPVLSVGSWQTRQDVKASRADSTNYVNNTGRLMAVSIWADVGTGARYMELVVDSMAVTSTGGTSAPNRLQVSGIVPPGSTYRVNVASISSIMGWVEMAI